MIYRDEINQIKSSGFGYDILCQKRKCVLRIAFTSMRFENLFHERKQYIRNNWACCDEMCVSYSQGKGEGIVIFQD
jgi:hypothetical protein